ncbi:FAD-dependent monooxygenase [Alcanivorax sp. S6407]|uniref:FAD-dependent oxidoreductase n=1 Tax=Alcanivorax sp. S6407 TaxID=2926424 RepID=UPI001FF50378|nr:NAD(P)/FAD-dependent oxidoreductase [Alcanivorax sp. S6407]MCK0154571.1 FAD-dependent monooxygenase [Alcanivorax sp. S6407]
MQPQSIALIGAGTAGLATAAVLAEQGHRVTLIERAKTLEPVGAGLLLQPSGLQVLREMGLYEAITHYGARIDALVGHTRSGRRIMNTSYGTLDTKLHGLGIHRASLCHVLSKHLQSLPHQRLMGHTVATVDTAEDHTMVETEHQGASQSFRFDAILIANGSHSQLRPAAWTRFDQLYPWGAMWSMQPMVNAFAAPLLQQRYHHASQMAGILPTGSQPDKPGQPLASFFWSLPVSQMADWQHPDFDFSFWRQQALQLWPELETFLAPLSHQSQLLAATYRDVIMDCWGKNRLGVIGDAAHGMSPQLGQGANMALLDARAIGKAVATSDSWPAVWETYHRQRGPQIRFYQRMSRWLTPAFQSHSRLVSTGRDLFFPLMEQIPWLRLQMVKTVAGLKEGLVD